MNQAFFADRFRCRAAVLIAAAVLPVLAAARADPLREQAVSSTGVWHDVDEQSIGVRPASVLTVAAKSRTLTLDRRALDSVLAQAPRSQPAQSKSRAAQPSPNARLDLPWPDGTMRQFRIEESPVMAPELSARFPSLRTYRGQGIDDRTATLRFDVTPAGFHAIVLSGDGTVYVEPYGRGDTGYYRSYYRRDAQRAARTFSCGVTTTDAASNTDRPRVTVQTNSTAGLRTYRLAVAATGEYTAVYGGTVDGALAGIVTTINRINSIYERDLSIHFDLVANNDLLIYTDASTDPYTNDASEQMLADNQTTIDAIIGPGNYDIGHVFGTIGGGLATVGSACQATKARGLSSIPDPIGDDFDVDYVAHEIGHQLGAHHTFNSTGEGCAGQRVAATAYEPGSGSTIMAYAGLCGLNENIQDHSDPYFHFASLAEIGAYTANLSGGASCGVVTPTDDTAPTVNAGPSYTIPRNTPFALTATGNDVDGDGVTYTWEERDLGAASPPSFDDGSRPVFRSEPPSASASASFPTLETLLHGPSGTGYNVDSSVRDMTFRVTARDNHSGGGLTASSDVVVHTGNSVFLAFGPSQGVVIGGPLALTWTNGVTTAAPYNVANVKISLSIDGGETFPVVLAASTPNSGSAVFTTPNLPTPNAILKVEAVGNIFYSITSSFLIDNAFNITVIKQGTGNGIVRGTGQAVNQQVELNCGPTCSAQYFSSVPMTLDPGTSPGSTFLGWTGDPDCVDGTLSTTFNHTCIATYRADSSGGKAVYDPTLMVPTCPTVSSTCDSQTLLNGRDGLASGSEANHPNTIYRSCADGSLGTYKVDESFEQMYIKTDNGGPFTPGQKVWVQTEVWAEKVTDALDLYYTADATNPSWTYLTTLTPSFLGLNGLTTSYILPTGRLQAVRARFRRGGTVGTCTSGDSFDDTDDMAFAVGMVQDRQFSTGSPWLQFATPDQSYMVSTISNGTFEFYRQPPPAGTSNQAVVFQETGVSLPAGSPVSATFDLGNSSSVRKRISVLLLEHDFSDLSVCTFWLPPNSSLRQYGMRTHALHPWSNAAIYFYAATPGFDGGYYQIANVDMEYEPAQSATRTECVDPTTPAPTGATSSGNLLTSGDFSSGLSPWGLFGQITQQITSGVFEFIRPPGTPAGVILQSTGTSTSTGDVLSAAFDLGNSSSVRKRVTVLLHDADFSDLTACTFWLEPGAPLQTFAMRGFSTQAWANATLSIYPATTGTEPWIQLDNVSLQRTPGLTITGTQCLEPTDLEVTQTSGAGGTTQSKPPGRPEGPAPGSSPPAIEPGAATEHVRRRTTLQR